MGQSFFAANDVFKGVLQRSSSYQEPVHVFDLDKLLAVLFVHASSINNSGAFSILAHSL